MHYRFKLEAIAPIVGIVEQLVRGDELDPISLGEWKLWKGILCYWVGKASESRQLLVEARRLIPLTCFTVSGIVEFYLALAGHMDGRSKVVLDDLENKLSEAHRLQFKYLSQLILGRAIVNMLLGQLNPINDDAYWLDNLGREHSSDYVVGLGRFMRGLYHFRANEIEATVKCLGPAISQRYNMHTRTVVDGLVTLALAYEAQGKSSTALETIEILIEFAKEMPGSHHLTVARSGKARLALAQGNMEGACRWLNTFNGPPAGTEMLIWLEVPSITQVRVLAAMGSRDNLKRAETLLAVLREVAESTHNICQLIDILALQSLVFLKQKREQDALMVLENALRLGEPGSWIRPFVEPGSDLEEPLCQLAGRLESRYYIDNILRAFFPKAHPSSEIVTGIHPNKPDIDKAAFELLTNREQQILKLLVQRLRDKEIADRLFISSQTVNFHLKNIYRKLGVNSRREAVALITNR